MSGILGKKGSLMAISILVPWKVLSKMNDKHADAS